MGRQARRVLQPFPCGDCGQVFGRAALRAEHDCPGPPTDPPPPSPAGQDPHLPSTTQVVVATLLRCYAMCIYSRTEKTPATGGCAGGARPPTRLHYTGAGEHGAGGGGPLLRHGGSHCSSGTSPFPQQSVTEQEQEALRCGGECGATDCSLTFKYPVQLKKHQECAASPPSLGQVQLDCYSTVPTLHSHCCTALHSIVTLL